MMSSRRDWLLEQMGITQYTLRRPRALQGEVAVSLPGHTRLLIVAEVPPLLTDPLIRDVLQAMLMREDEVAVLTPDQLAMLPETRCASWYLGIAPPAALNGSQIASPVLAELYHNAGAKRALWQQISQHESDFFTDPARS
ncbi:DNA polymerase III subunit psi [Erwinia sp. MMLR14_017]|uniref:DNA polymerase III subunit psi n=1 Tax=Erwinia sp. MMLR14_017 TaxID=3093842 RepID=UPI0029907D59|nr:DNA polymerase III subunit psi [Erwinia sp. MMLR14_017]MDW8844634.1 DNA polymerase III subunit psi [Erwinia sp. MMLR14_017]